MTRDAIHRRRVYLEVRLPERCVLYAVAFGAKRLHGFCQQLLLAGEMRAVAAQAISPRRGMHLLLPHLLLEILVAGEAEVGTLGQHEPVQLPLVGTVAFRAFPRGNGGMTALPALQPFLQLGMAFEADLVLLRDDHPVEIGSVGVVTGQALPPFEGLVADAAGYLFHQILVAIGT